MRGTKFFFFLVCVAYANPLIKVYTSVILPPLDVAASFALTGLVVHVHQPRKKKVGF